MESSSGASPLATLISLLTLPEKTVAQLDADTLMTSLSHVHDASVAVLHHLELGDPSRDVIQLIKDLTQQKILSSLTQDSELLSTYSTLNALIVNRF